MHRPHSVTAALFVISASLVLGQAACKDDGGDADPCTASTDCSGATPFCDTAAGACVECLAPTDCPTGETCVGQACVVITGCSDSGDCSGATPICDTAAGACVECLVPTDCAATGYLCTNHVCVQDTSCSSSTECSGATPVCDTASGACVECLVPTDCAVAGYLCTNHVCVEDTTDPYAAARVICINKINELRATKGLPAYDRWSSAESCADTQATQDESTNSPHGSFGQCSENAQNECLGGGAAGIESCLESMWAEKDQAGCSGCDACAGAYDPNCPNCDFYGTDTGDVCGHYVNMSALYLTGAACGFSSLGGWAVIDFH